MFKVYIRRTDFARRLNLYIIEQSEVDETISFVVQENGEIVIKSVTSRNLNDEIKPFMSLSGPLGIDFLQSMAEALDEEGIKTDKDAKIQGTLEATRHHLEDLRSLLKLNKGK